MGRFDCIDIPFTINVHIDKSLVHFVVCFLWCCQSPHLSTNNRHTYDKINTLLYSSIPKQLEKLVKQALTDWLLDHTKTHTAPPSLNIKRSLQYLTSKVLRLTWLTFMKYM